ncbi:MAG: septal ring lytic transglycosylase RlpA family protein [Methylacidiphilales bacterium]|nr:septal ring lytic transglycosylase RlpA family protein [Candidatus Methylacidiphilales bacterium]
MKSVNLFSYFAVSLFLISCAKNLQPPSATIPSESSRVYSRSYVVLGKRYFVLASIDNFIERGVASWYGKEFHGRKTSSGTIYDMHKLTAAHKQLPLNTTVEVTNLENGKKITVLVNDRGPFHEDRIIDLSYAAASMLGIVQKGTGQVEVKAIGSNSSIQNNVAQPEDALRGLSTPIYIQLGAFAALSNAQKIAMQAENKGYSVIIQEKQVNGGVLHRVRLGPMDYATHVQLLDSLKKDGFSFAVRMIDQ